MKRSTLAIALGSIFITGCADFLGKEMNIEAGIKTRPIAVIIEPPEAMPGDSITVVAYYYDPTPSATAVSWKLALDYRFNLYGTIETEAHVLDLTEKLWGERIETDDEGMVRHEFRVAIPDSVFLVAGSIPDVIDEEFPSEIRALIGVEENAPVTKRDLATFLHAVDPATLAPEAYLWFAAYADFFTCQIRLRGKIVNEIELDVTKNLTIRYSRKFGSDNVNTNPTIESLAILQVHHTDVDDRNDIGLYATDTTYVYHQDPAVTRDHTIAVNHSYTYYILMTHAVETYRSPAGIEHPEEHEYAWYVSGLGFAGNEEPLFVADDGGEGDHDMFEEIVRLDPPGGPRSWRVMVYGVLRDERREWRMYHGVPGAALAAGEILFEY